MKRIVWLLLAGVLLINCGKLSQGIQSDSKANNQKTNQERAEALKIAVMPTLDCLPVFVAQQYGLFDTLRVDVRLYPFTAQMDCDTAIVGGSVEGVFSDLVRTEKLQKQGVMLDYLSTTTLQWQLISNRKSRLKQLQQLGDKMIAMTRYSATDYLTDIALKGVKTKAQVFKVQINDVNIRLHMLLNNEMDAMWLPEPYATTARLYQHVVLTQSHKMEKQLGVLAFRQKAMQTKHRKRQLKLFEQAYNNAVDSINKNGFTYYSDIIIKHCNTDKKTIKALPKLKYQHITSPTNENIQAAKLYVRSIQ